MGIRKIKTRAFIMNISKQRVNDQRDFKAEPGKGSRPWQKGTKSEVQVGKKKKETKKVLNERDKIRREYGRIISLFNAREMHASAGPT